MFNRINIMINKGLKTFSLFYEWKERIDALTSNKNITYTECISISERCFIILTRLCTKYPDKWHEMALVALEKTIPELKWNIKWLKNSISEESSSNKMISIRELASGGADLYNYRIVNTKMNYLCYIFPDNRIELWDIEKIRLNASSVEEAKSFFEDGNKQGLYGFAFEANSKIPDMQFLEQCFRRLKKNCVSHISIKDRDEIMMEVDEEIWENNNIRNNFYANLKRKLQKQIGLMYQPERKNDDFRGTDDAKYFEKLIKTTKRDKWEFNIYHADIIIVDEKSADA